jgi:peptide/nickel transport system permease protein
MTEHNDRMGDLSGQAVQLEAHAKIDSPTVIAWRRFRRHHLAMISLMVLVIISIMVIGAPLFARYDPIGMNLRDRALAPSSEHWFGTDNLGRDMWARTIYGGRVSLEVGLAAALISTVIGVILGSISGYYGRWVDMTIMRLTDVVMTFPPIIIMLTVAAIAGTGLTNVILIIGGLRWPGTTRLVRGQFLSLKNQEFVLAARTMGMPDWIIIVRHILPNVMAPLMANITFAVSAAILAEAGLSFLGMGIPLPTPTWGNIMENARSLAILQDKPWMWLPATGATLITVLCINFVGDGLRDALDPQQVL